MVLWRRDHSGDVPNMEYQEMNILPPINIPLLEMRRRNAWGLRVANRSNYFLVMWAHGDDAFLPLDTWMRVLNDEATLWQEWQRINDIFGGNGGALMMLLARTAIMSSECKTLRDLNHWGRKISALGNSYK